MQDSVDGIHTLLGSRLRDAHRNRVGRIVGIDQTRETPALLVAWSEGRGIERVPVSREELRALVASSVAQEPHDAGRHSQRTQRDDDAGNVPEHLDMEPLATGTARSH